MEQKWFWRKSRKVIKKIIKIKKFISFFKRIPVICKTLRNYYIDISNNNKTCKLCIGFTNLNHYDSLL